MKEFVSPRSGIVTTLRLARDRTGAFQGIARECGDFAKVRVPGRDIYFVFHPDAVSHVLQGNSANYRKSFDWEIVATLLGQGLITSHDKQWRSDRKSVQPLFHRQALQGYLASMRVALQQRIARWDDCPRIDDALSECAAISCEVVARTLFGSRKDLNHALILDRLSTCLAHLEGRLTLDWNPGDRIPTPGVLRFRAARRDLMQLMDELIDECQNQPGEKGGIIPTLLDEARRQGIANPRSWIRDHALTFFVAGFETTAVAMTWALYLLATHPRVQDRLAEEVRSIGVAPERLGAEDLPRLRYCRNVIFEALRLFPPVWAIGRESITEDSVLGYRLPAGATVAVSPFALHRDPRFWPESDRFLPERFELEEDRHRFAFFPFSGGARHCIGEAFAMQELTLFLAYAVSRFDIRLAGPFEPKFRAMIALRPKNALRLRLSARSPL